MAMLRADQGKTFPPVHLRILHNDAHYLAALYRHTLIPPLGYKIAGIAGSCASWVDSLSLIVQH